MVNNTEHKGFLFKFIKAAFYLENPTSNAGTLPKIIWELKYTCNKMEILL